MNSRKWQVGMVAMVVLSLGLLSFAPFLWRTLRLRERSTMVVLAVVAALETLWFALSIEVDVDPDKSGGVYSLGDVGGFFGVLTILVAAFSAAWIFRPYRKEEITNPWNGG